MRIYIYEENGKYYREIRDFVNIKILKEEISETEYLKAKNRKGG